MKRQTWSLVMLAAVLFAGRALATTYYVDTRHAQARDTNAGTSPSLPWKTIQKAASTMVAGDTVNIAAGTYDESVTMQNAGTATNKITYQALPGAAVVIPQDFIVGKDHVVVRGLEISGASLRIEGSYCQLLGNYVHHAETCGVFLHGAYNLLRGNRIANNGAVWGDQITTGWDNGNSAHHYVLEENDVSDEEGKGEDLMQYMGHDALIRNNRFHHLGSANERHNDVYQSGGDEFNIWMIGNRFEYLDNIQYYMVGAGDHDHVWRGNLFWGSVGWGFNGNPAGMRVVNNTFALFPGSYGVGGVGKARNNIFSPPGSDGHGGDVDYSIVNPIPCCSDRGPHDLWGVEPLFVDFANRDFHLQSASRGINGGTFITTATSTGSGTQLPVADAKLFVDGFGIVDGDSVQLEGQTQTAKITRINYATNTLTLDRSLSWTSGQGVSLPYVGSAPDIGAFEFGQVVRPAMPSAPKNLRVQ